MRTKTIWEAMELVQLTDDIEGPKWAEPDGSLTTWYSSSPTHSTIYATNLTTNRLYAIATGESQYQLIKPFASQGYVHWMERRGGDELLWWWEEATGDTGYQIFSEGTQVNPQDFHWPWLGVAEYTRVEPLGSRGWLINLETGAEVMLYNETSAPVVGPRNQAIGIGFDWPTVVFGYTRAGDDGGFTTLRTWNMDTDLNRTFELDDVVIEMHVGRGWAIVLGQDYRIVDLTSGVADYVSEAGPGTACGEFDAGGDWAIIECRWKLFAFNAASGQRFVLESDRVHDEGKLIPDFVIAQARTDGERIVLTIQVRNPDRFGPVQTDFYWVSIDALGPNHPAVGLWG